MDHPVLIDFKNVEERKKYFFSKTKKIEERKRCSVIYNHLQQCPPQYYILLGSLWSLVIVFNKVRRQPSNIYVFVSLYLLKSNCTVCK